MKAATGSRTTTVTLPTNEQILITNHGTHVGLHGEFRQILPRERLVYTEVWDDRPAAEAVVTVALTSADAKTTVARLAQFHNVQDRDEHLQRMQCGLQAAMALFEQIVLSL
jgi:uncharacterized protein YndB with AHSA1/START domain